MKEQFALHLEKHFQEVFEPLIPLQKTIRQRIWDRFLELGLAEKKNAGYQYFPLTQFYQETYALGKREEIPQGQIAALIQPECRRSYVVFVNGHYCPELSDTSAVPSEVVILPIHEAISTYGHFLQSRLAKILVEETDPFAILNIVLSQNGLFVYVPTKIQIEVPIQCLHFLSSDRPTIINPRIRFILGREAKLNWFYDHHCFKDFEYFTNGVVDIALDEGASFEQYGILSSCPPGWCFEATRVSQKRDSQFKSITCTTGTKGVKQDFRVTLMGENSSCELKGVSNLSQNRQSHVNILVDHQAPHCRSNQHFKNILGDTSRCSFEGKIYVHPKAQKTEAYQLSNTLLLSDTAVSNSKPNLEIFADDVKASHGATVTQTNPEHLHYLQTRGIRSEEAKQLLLASFGRDILSQVPHQAVRERMEQHL
ncbi:MAG: Fe-S cluster assembly protein SufD [Verrucomicrobia bacterium]|nr:Fe-S cluster assembly protein SufD [Verrucomicrobiota bacterium]